VLVPGGWHGGWWYEPVAEDLRRAGHDVYCVTLTGLGDDRGIGPAAANLDTHIEDVTALLEGERISDAVIVGHSYGGMVITGAADRCPDRVARLVYSDAYVPADGESCWDLTTPAFRQMFIEGAADDGRTVTPPPGGDSRKAAHPLASFLQRIRLSGAPSRVRRRDFIYLSGWAGSPFTGVHEQLSRDPAWHTHTVPVGHNVMAEAPDALLEILLDNSTA
jgi:pimeloyl-ACP methyl ester carboxylesterase